MHKCGISDYEKFYRQLLENISDRPISMKVFSDEFDEMERQAYIISSWGKNAFVKIPVTNTRRVSSERLIQRLVTKGIKLNVTALLTLKGTGNFSGFR